MKVRVFIFDKQTGTGPARLVDVHAVPQKHDSLIVIDESRGVPGAPTELRRMLVVNDVHHLAIYPGKPDVAAELYCKE